MRLANRCAASEQVKQAIKNFKCSVCEELKPPAINRKVTMPHVEQPNKMVGLDFVQVELIRDDENGEQEEQKFNVLTCVCMATDFCQQVVIPEGAGALSQAFHEAWIRPYGAPETVYMDPAYIPIGSWEDLKLRIEFYVEWLSAFGDHRQDRQRNHGEEHVPVGTLHEGDAPPLVSLEQPSSKRLKTVPEQPQEERAASVSYEPSIAPSVLDDEMPDQETFSDQPLNADEIPRAASLLLRAVKHGQAQHVLGFIKEAPGAKPFWAGCYHVMDAARPSGYQDPMSMPSTSMNDASKRRVPDDTLSWENVTENGESLSDASYIASMPETVNIPPPWTDGSNPLLQVMKEIQEDVKIPIPSDIASVHKWGECICETEKYQTAGLSYYELVFKAKTDSDCKQYLSWIKGRFGYVQGKDHPPDKMTPGKDLARFLQRIGWTGTESATSFHRRFKK
ncbi:unnamed protein product [Cladocopium goreaui]|uniref:Copia protein n=1 Tax=Cladocopium goreaui TaxID=2562237 RepID=A0A9P1GK93_9DINO|nr:unnamed protein product [Cladocopium goreaui]